MRRAALGVVVLVLITARAARADLLQQARDTAQRIADRQTSQGQPADRTDQDEAQDWPVAEMAAAASAAVASTCDLGATLSSALRHWKNGDTEVGFARHFLGATPSPVAVTAYFATAALAEMAISHIIPQRYRPYFYGMVALGEGYTNMINARNTRGICGIGRRR